MELELWNCIYNWTITRKARTRRPRKSGPHTFEPHIQLHERKKRRLLLHQSTSQTPCVNRPSPTSQIPSFFHEEYSGRPRSRKTKSRTRFRNSKILKPTNNDFSGIELLASVACSSIIYDNATPPGINSCTVDDIKDFKSNGSSIQQNVQGNGKLVDGNNVFLSKELRLHWDLNTVMHEWEEPCHDLLIEAQLTVKSDAVISLAENCKNGSVEETHKLIDIKTSDGDSCVSKSDVVDLLTHSGKCEDFSNSTTEVLMEQTTVVNFESDRTDNLVVNQQPVCGEVVQDHVSECCGSNVTQEETGHMAEGGSEDKLQAGYDSPFEDGELRELNEKETVCKSVKKIDKDDLGTIENPLSETVDHGQTTGDQTSLLVKEAVERFDESRKKICERKEGHDDSVGRKLLQIDNSTSFDVCRNGEYIHRTRSITSEDFSMRIWDLQSHRILDSDYFRKYNPRGGSHRTHDRRSSPSPSERNNGYGSNRGTPPARSHNRDRYRFQSHHYHEPKHCYLDRKPRIYQNLNRSRSRSRSGSPIAWHFQKRTSNPDEIQTVTSPERSSKCFHDRRFMDGHFRDNRQSSVMIKQRFDPIGYPERLKSDDYFRRASFSHDWLQIHTRITGDMEKESRRRSDGNNLRPKIG